MLRFSAGCLILAKIEIKVSVHITARPDLDSLTFGNGRPKSQNAVFLSASANKNHWSHICYAKEKDIFTIHK